MKIVLGVLGALAVMVGCIWILQGVNILPGSFMTGDIRWAYRGAAVAAVGGLFFLWALRAPDVRRNVVGTIGVIMMVMGTIWILQGVNVLPGSVMTGDIRWAYRGAVQATIGFALLVFSLRLRTAV